MRTQKFISSPFCQPFNTVEGVLDGAMTGQTSDVVESQSSVDPLWIVLPLCVAIIAVLLFVVVVIVLRSVASSLLIDTCSSAVMDGSVFAAKVHFILTSNPLHYTTVQSTA